MKVKNQGKWPTAVADAAANDPCQRIRGPPVKKIVINFFIVIIVADRLNWIMLL